MITTPSQFLEELFGDKDEDSRILIWLNPGKISKWFQSSTEAGVYVESLSSKPVNCYFGCGLRSCSLGPNKRGEHHDIIGIPGFWIDIDVAGDTHSNKNLPATIDQALSLVEGRGWDPTFTVMSGNGLQSWWLFKEIWMFGSPEERTQAFELSRQLQATIREFAKEHGWAVDSTHDLSRVLRPVGTFNHKTAPPKPVVMLRHSGIRYADPGDFEQWMVKATEVQQVDKEAIVETQNGLTLDINCQIDTTALDMAMEADPLLRASWERKRTDLVDQSPSSYHMSIANLCAANGFTAQEIANIIIAWNRKHNESFDKVIRRPDYMARTVCMAIEAFGDKDQLAQVKGEAPLCDQEEKHQEDLRNELATLTGLKFISILKYLQETGAVWVVQTDRGAITFKSVDQIATMKRFINTVFEALNVYLRLSPKKWPTIVNLIGALTIEIDVGEEGTLEGRMVSWLESYLYNAAPVDMEQSLVQDDCPFVYNGFWYVYPRKLRQYTWQYFGNTNSINALLVDLKRVGASPARFNPINPNDPNKRTTKRPWKIPKRIVKAPAQLTNSASASSYSLIAMDDETGDQPTIH